MDSFVESGSGSGPTMRTVDVVVDTSSIGGRSPITLRNVPLPLSFHGLVRKLTSQGVCLH